ncbi:hypothetical protein [Saccharothrix xinjiangensis]|uniref:Thioesterase superfamily protein n=1 Tax=Saccharothrix xinjiangensis TaxID=204798 RepID=A0ABV9XY14_9PSEU
MIAESGVVVPARFSGAPDTAHGGYTCGVLASSVGPVDGTPVVSLLLPVPVEQPMHLEVSADQAVLVFGEQVVATMVASPDPVPVAPPVGLLEAERAAEAYAGFDAHPSPTCFACGHDRLDGLLLSPGLVGENAVACTWTPVETSPEVLWAALDCPASWATDEPMTLTRMAADLVSPPVLGERHVVVARQVQRVGPVAATVTSIYGPGDVLVATATAQWTEPER